MRRFALVGALALAGAVAVAGCTTGITAPRFEPPADAEEAIAQAREAVEEVESYRYTVIATSDENTAQAEGAWAAPDDFSLESDAFGFLVLGATDRPFEYVSMDGRIFQREGGVDGPWRELQLPRSLLAVAPPLTLVVSADEWELVERDASGEDGVYHLRGTRIPEPQLYRDAHGQETGEAFQAFLTYDLTLSAQTMLPIRRETRMVNQGFDVAGELVAEWTRTWIYEFHDYNAPITIGLPEPREELPDPDATPPTPTPTLPAR